MADNDNDTRLRRSDLDRVATALAHSGVRSAQYLRIMAALTAELLDANGHRVLTKSAPASSRRSIERDPDRSPGEGDRGPPRKED
jgi:hypothetical protein